MKTQYRFTTKIVNKHYHFSDEKELDDFIQRYRWESRKRTAKKEKNDSYSTADYKVLAEIYTLKNFRTYRYFDTVLKFRFEIKKYYKVRGKKKIFDGGILKVIAEFT